MTKQVHAFVSPDEPIHLLLPEEVAHETRSTRWMLRILQAPAAMAARGYPDGVAGSTALALKDPLLTGESGTWLLEIEDGVGSLTLDPTGPEPLRLGPNGLAALYAGFPVHALRAAGLAAGGTSTGDRFLDSAFSNRAAYLLEYF